MVEWLIGLCAILASTSLIFILWFNRDPNRQTIKNDRVIVSPADGRVIYVNSVNAGSRPVPKKFGKGIKLTELENMKLFDRGAIHIGIYLSPFDVHTTRAPISGKVNLSVHHPARLFSWQAPHLRFQNERSTCVIQGSIVAVVVVQMAAFLVRRVIISAQSNTGTEMGQRIGKIRLGSQVDVIISPSSELQVSVKPGDRVKAGESIVATIG